MRKKRDEGRGLGEVTKIIPPAPDSASGQVFVDGGVWPCICSRAWFEANQPEVGGFIQLDPVTGQPVYLAAAAAQHDLSPTDLPTPTTGAALLGWRHACGWSQADLSKRIGVDKTTLGWAERSPTKPLSPGLVARLEGLRVRHEPAGGREGEDRPVAESAPAKNRSL